MKKYIFLLALILIVGVLFIPVGTMASAEVSITDEVKRMIEEEREKEKETEN